MRNGLIRRGIFAFLLVIGVTLLWRGATSQTTREETNTIQQTEIMQRATIDNKLPTPTPPFLPVSHAIPHRLQAFQTFNNCGPATLSMLLSYVDASHSQQAIGQELRPYQNPQGDNDDKSVTFGELARYAQGLGFVAYHRPNGTIDLLKRLIAEDIPVGVRTWLNPGEDIGHYRVVRGYDDNQTRITQDDSYHGPHLTYGYDELLAMWQPFNYEYLIVVRPEKQGIVDSILGENVQDQTAWRHALERANRESQEDPQSPYSIFNQAIAHYELGNYEETIVFYEQVANNLPGRMLWYQTEPIAAYEKTKNYQRVFELTDSILSNQNRAFSELYIIRGDAHKAQGNIDLARLEYEKAVLYNQNLQTAKERLDSLTY